MRGGLNLNTRISGIVDLAIHQWIEEHNPSAPGQMDFFVSSDPDDSLGCLRVYLVYREASGSAYVNHSRLLYLETATTEEITRAVHEVLDSTKFEVTKHP